MSTELNFPVSRYGTFLATRSLGRTVRTELEDRAATCPDGAVIIDFRGVEAITISFADECVARFIGDHNHRVETTLVVVAGLNEETSEAVSVSLERRDLGVAILADDQLSWQPGPSYLQETYKSALGFGTFRASELAAALQLSLPNANNRLKKLVACGALARERWAGPDRGGKEFMYRVAQIRTRVS